LPFDWTHRFSSLVLSLVPSLAIPFLPAISIEPTNALAILVFLLVMAASFALFAMARRSSQHSSQHSSLRIDFIALGWVFSVLMLLSTAFTHPKGDGAGYLPALGLAIALSAAFETLLSHLRKRRSPRWMLHVLAGIVGLIWLSLAWTASDRVHHWQPVESKAKERQESRSKEATHDLDIGKG
jgi:EamA domain-containing membrane protein RarD